MVSLRGRSHIASNLDDGARVHPRVARCNIRGTHLAGHQGIEHRSQASADFDGELRAHGIASLIAASFGGLTISLQVGTSRLLEHAGGATRMSEVVCALVLGFVGLTNFNLQGLIPIVWPKHPAETAPSTFKKNPPQ